MNHLIRLATADDARAVTKIHVAGWQTGYRGLLPDAHLDALTVDDRVSGWSSAIVSGPRLLVAEGEGEGGVSGFVTFGATRDDDLPVTTGEVFALYVHPATWGRGIGGLLLDAAVDELTRTGHPTHALWTLHDNTRAHHFYERRGWVSDGSTKSDRRSNLTLVEVRYRHR